MFNQNLTWPVYKKISQLIYQRRLETCNVCIVIPHVRHATKALPYEVKMQYAQISNMIDTSIKFHMSGQSTPIVKGFMDICLIFIVHCL